MGEVARVLPEISDYFSARRGEKPFLAKEGKKSPLIAVAAPELGYYPFIAINQCDLRIVHVEVDSIDVSGEHLLEPAFDIQTYDDFNIPWPNYAVISSGHRFHAFWILERSLPKSATFRSMSYFHDVRAKLIYALGGDPACNIAGAVRNPFCTKAKVREFSRRPHRLADLNLGIKVNAKTYEKYRSLYQPGVRNCSTFTAALGYYREHQGLVEFEELVTWIKTFQGLYPGVEPLPYVEVRSIAASIVKNGQRYRVRANRNYGRMNLAPVDYSDMDEEERLAMIRSRQSTGAAFVHDQRRQGTIDRMVCAWEALTREGVAPTQKAVSTRAGISLRTAKTYWRTPSFMTRANSS